MWKVEVIESVAENCRCCATVLRVHTIRQCPLPYRLNRSRTLLAVATTTKTATAPPPHTHIYIYEGGLCHRFFTQNKRQINSFPWSPTTTATAHACARARIYIHPPIPQPAKAHQFIPVWHTKQQQNTRDRSIDSSTSNRRYVFRCHTPTSNKTHVKRWTLIPPIPQPALTHKIKFHSMVTQQQQETAPAHMCARMDPPPPLPVNSVD